MTETYLCMRRFLAAFGLRIWNPIAVSLVVTLRRNSLLLREGSQVERFDLRVPNADGSDHKATSGEIMDGVDL